MASIEFEYRSEVQEIMRVIDKYVKQNPEERKNETLKKLYGHLDVMDMEW